MSRPERTAFFVHDGVGFLSDLITNYFVSHFCSRLSAIGEATPLIV